MNDGGGCWGHLEAEPGYPELAFVFSHCPPPLCFKVDSRKTCDHPGLGLSLVSVILSCGWREAHLSDPSSRRILFSDKEGS